MNMVGCILIVDSVLINCIIIKVWLILVCYDVMVVGLGVEVLWQVCLIQLQIVLIGIVLYDMMFFVLCVVLCDLFGGMDLFIFVYVFEVGVCIVVLKVGVLVLIDVLGDELMLLVCICGLMCVDEFEFSGMVEVQVGFMYDDRFCVVFVVDQLVIVLGWCYVLQMWLDFLILICDFEGVFVDVVCGWVLDFYLIVVDIQ